VSNSGCIGETDETGERINNRRTTNRNPFRFDEVIVFYSDNVLNKAHVKSLESYIFYHLEEKGFSIEFGNRPKPTALNEFDQSIVDEYFIILQRLLSFEDTKRSSGRKIHYSFTPGMRDNRETMSSIQPSSESLSDYNLHYKLYGLGLVATAMILQGNKMTLLKGSQIRLDEQPSCSYNITDERMKMRKRGLLNRKKGYYVLRNDYMCSSPSKAAGIVLGSAGSARNVWKQADTGRSL